MLNKVNDVSVKYEGGIFNIKVGTPKSHTIIKVEEREYLEVLGNRNLIRFMYERTPLILNSRSLILEPKPDGHVILKVGDKESYKVFIDLVLQGLYFGLDSYWHHQYKEGKCSLEDCLFYSWVELFEEPNLGLLITRGLDVPYPVCKWNRGLFLRLVQGCKFSYLDEDVIQKFVSYIPLALELLQLQWLMTYGEGDDYSYLKTIESHYLGQGPVPKPIINLPDWEETTPCCHVGTYLLEAIAKEQEYISARYTGGDIYKGRLLQIGAVYKGVSLSSLIN